MSDMQANDANVGFDLPAIDRRKLIGGMAVLTAASTVAAPALARVTGADVRSYRAGYALRGGMTINGFFAAPKGRNDLAVVVVIPANDGASAEEIAQGYARNGYLAIVPDLSKAQGDVPASASREAKMNEVMRSLPRFKTLMHGSGRVSVVTA